jgi:hypothetical protein
MAFFLTTSFTVICQIDHALTSNTQRNLNWIKHEVRALWQPTHTKLYFLSLYFFPVWNPWQWKACTEISVVPNSHNAIPYQETKKKGLYPGFPFLTIEISTTGTSKTVCQENWNNEFFSMYSLVEFGCQWTDAGDTWIVYTCGESKPWVPYAGWNRQEVNYAVKKLGLDVWPSMTWHACVLLYLQENAKSTCGLCPRFPERLRDWTVLS